MVAMSRSLAISLCCLAACHRGAHDPRSFAELFAGTKAPSLAGPLGVVVWGHPLTESQQALRAHATDTLTYAAVGDAMARLKRIDITSSEDPDPEPELVRLWGPPTVTTKLSSGMTPAGTKIWYGDHVRALLPPRNETWMVELALYVPLAAQLGDPSTPLFGFERGEPLIGSSRDEIAQRYKDLLQEVGSGVITELALPSNELGSQHVVLRFDAQNTVTAIELDVAMAKELAPARQGSLLRRFGKTALTSDERAQGFTWNPCPTGEKCTGPAAYRVHILDSDAPDEPWHVTVANAN
jgi:hypothetical protein